MKKKDKNVWILFFGSIFLCFLFVLQYGVFGSKVDWVTQHSVLPDYFRQHFYATGNLFPDIAWNLGGGQNIYNFSYYGLFNPVLLLSFLLPFVRMDYYVMASSMLCYALSVVLFYRWLAGKEMPESIRFWTSWMFALSAPLLFHSYNQLMFVNYMPFLCLSLIGTDWYFIKGRRSFLILGVTGMILTSFYFSIGGMAALCIYVLGEYLAKDIRSKILWNRAVRFVGNLLLSVLLTGILLVPTAASLFAGNRENHSSDISLKLMDFNPERFVYSPYGLGLTTLAIIALFAGVLHGKKKADRVLSLCLLLVLCVPVFGYLLNGGLYDKSKVFIPFLPLVCLVIAGYMTELMEESNTGRSARKLLPYVLALLLIYFSWLQGDLDRYFPLVLLDAAGMLALYFVSRKWNRIPLQLMVSCLILFCYGWEMHLSRDYMISYEEYAAITADEKKENVKTVLDGDDSLYRLEQIGTGAENLRNINRILDIRQNITSIYSSAYNEDYYQFRKHVFQLNEPNRNDMMQAPTDNPCFLTFMGVKYVLTDGQITENTDIAPLVYATNQTMTEEQYRALSFPDNQTSLLQKTVVPEGKASHAAEDESLSRMRSCGFTLPENHSPELTIHKTEKGYRIEAKEETTITAALSGTRKTDTLFALAFDVDNKRPGRDMYIRMQGQTNRLSTAHEYANHNTDFTYMVTLQKGVSYVEIQLGPGSYEIENLKAFTGNLDALKNPDLYASACDTIKQKDGGDTLEGTLEVQNDGFFITSIPYDANFTLLIDGKKAELLKVNTAFVGAKITKGKHRITLSYHAPGKLAGFALSLAGLLLLLIPCALRRERTGKKS